VLSLLPAVGAVLVWGPVAAYFFFTGEVVKGIGLTVWGALVIGLVDNVLRPVLVGKDTRMPDYLVLVATLGGIVVFGLNGFVIGPVIAAVFLVSWEMLASARQQPVVPPRP
jgi:predicted PurR-regulated permease PerM